MAEFMEGVDLLGDQKEATRIGNEIAKRVYPRRRFLGGLPAMNDTQGHATVLGHSTKHCRSDSKKCYRRVAWIVRAKVEASVAIRSNLATAFRISVGVPALRWSTICCRSRCISLMLSVM